MFFTRLASSIVLLASIIFLGIFGGFPLLLFIGVISIIGLIELFRIFEIEKSPLAIFAYIMAALYEFVIYTSGLTLACTVIFALLLGSIIVFVVAFPKYKVKEIMLVVFGFIYIVFTLSFIFLVRVLNEGNLLVWLIFISAWGNDTLAYCAGMLFGKHKMSPKLSPKKSVEGLIGGIAGAGLLGFIYALIFQDSFNFVFNNPLVIIPIITAVTGGVSVIGDLAASGIKREFGIKDYGNIIPGHGGVLDRFDSIIVTAPLVFFAIMFVTIIGL